MPNLGYETVMIKLTTELCRFYRKKAEDNKISFRKLLIKTLCDKLEALEIYDCNRFFVFFHNYEGERYLIKLRNDIYNGLIQQCKDNNMTFDNLITNILLEDKRDTLTKLYDKQHEFVTKKLSKSVEV